MGITRSTRRTMFHTDLHKATMVEILRNMYADPLLRTILGFKGGTAAMLFYDLPRFSVDLDFDLLDEQKKASVMARLQTILPQTGTVREAVEKRYTLFFLLSYDKDERNIKIEISKRPSGSRFTPMTHLGISMLVIVQEDAVANKLAALLTRKRFASRDVFDAWFFLKNHWPVRHALLQEKTGMSLSQALKTAEKRVERIKPTDLLSGLGELLDEKQKIWAKDHLVDDTLFYLRLYRESL